MPLRLPRVSYSILILATWLFVSAFSPHTGDSEFLLQSPAQYLSVGQEFTPRLLSLQGAAGVEVELLDLSGHRVAIRQATLEAGGEVDIAAMSLPHPGGFVLKATQVDAPHPDKTIQTIKLEAIEEPSSLYGGVIPIQEAGLDEGVIGYLRAHAFAVAPRTAGTDLLVLVGDPAMDGSDLRHEYSDLWRDVGNGTNVVFLEPPTPQVAAYWPIVAPLVAAVPDCSSRALPAESLALMQVLSTDLRSTSVLGPDVVFDLSSESTVDLYSADGTRWLRQPGAKGYPGCHPVFSYRYGDGWVTLSTLPLLRNFQDTRARIYLMNLIRIAAGRKRSAPASPGLLWVTEQRIKSLSSSGPSSNLASTLEAGYYVAPPEHIIAPPIPVPSLTDGNVNTCLEPAKFERQGSGVMLMLHQPSEVRDLVIDFKKPVSSDSTPFRLEGTRNGVKWEMLAWTLDATNPSVKSGMGEKQYLQVPMGLWRGFRMTSVSDRENDLPNLCELSVR